MMGTRRWWLAVVVLAIGLGEPGKGTAGPLLPGRTHEEHFCPPSSYSPCHYWAPTLYRLKVCLHGPTLDINPPDRHPGTPAQYDVQAFPCPVGMATFYADRLGSAGATLSKPAPAAGERGASAP